MKNIPEIHFDTLHEFKTHCKSNSTISHITIQYRAQKHQNRMGEFLHDIDGFVYNQNETYNVRFVIDEMHGLREKKHSIETGLVSDILN